MAIYPSALLFDFSGTLARVRGGGIGPHYLRAIEHIGQRALPSSVTAESLQGSFKRAYTEQWRSKPNFGGRSSQVHFRWWGDVIRACVASTEGLALTPSEVTELCSYMYREAPGWYELFPDSAPFLHALRTGEDSARTHTLILSNFDSRLDEIVERLGIARMFDGIVATGNMGASKPDRAVFYEALAVAGMGPDQAEYAWHVGDDDHADGKGAKGAGLKSILIDREDKRPQGEPWTWKIKSLQEIHHLAQANKDHY
jgi:FMN phosphatase YigB (HAD superfamily)